MSTNLSRILMFLNSHKFFLWGLNAWSPNSSLEKLKESWRDLKVQGFSVGIWYKETNLLPKTSTSINAANVHASNASTVIGLLPIIQYFITKTNQKGQKHKISFSSLQSQIQIVLGSKEYLNNCYNSEDSSNILTHIRMAGHSVYQI